MKPGDIHFDKAVQLLRDYLYAKTKKRKKKPVRATYLGFQPVYATNQWQKA